MSEKFNKQGRIKYVLKFTKCCQSIIQYRYLAFDICILVAKRVRKSEAMGTADGVSVGRNNIRFIS